MILEDRGVRKEALIDLQEIAKAGIYLSEDSLDNFRGLLKNHRLGNKFHLAFILEQLYALGLDFKNNSERRAIECAFLGRLLRYSMNYSLREMKYKARIPVPNSYQLVGVADEGQAYIREGADSEKVFTLGKGRIYGTIYHANSTAPCSTVHKMIRSLCARICGQRPHISEGKMRPLQEPSDPPW